MPRRKLILFDLDGTLISPGPVPRQILSTVISEHVGQAIRLEIADVAGSIDPAIVRSAIRRSGQTVANELASVDEILSVYAERVETTLSTSNEVKVFDGARELVAACRDEGWATAILTGNIRRAAEAKLDGTGLEALFDFGVYGDDGNRREDLPFLASERAWDALEEAFPPSVTTLVGDTPADALVARLAQMSSLIVCRRNESSWRAAIDAELPTSVVDSLEQTEELINRLKDL